MLNYIQRNPIRSTDSRPSFDLYLGFSFKDAERRGPILENLPFSKAKHLAKVAAQAKGQLAARRKAVFDAHKSQGDNRHE